MWRCCSNTVVHCGSLGVWGVREGVTSAGERAKNSRGREGGGRGRDCSAFCLLQSRCCFPINSVPACEKFQSSLGLTNSKPPGKTSQLNSRKVPNPTIFRKTCIRVFFSAQMDDGVSAHQLFAMKGATFEGAVPELACRGR